VNLVYTGSGASYFGVAPDPGDDAPGVRLTMVQPGGPADRAGFRDGDIVLRFDGLRVYTQEDLREAIGSKRPGDSVAVVYLRDGREHTGRAILGARPGG
jgi:S1-C subfamily serine protease